MRIPPPVTNTVGAWPFQGSLVDVSGNALDFGQGSGEHLGNFVFLEPTDPTLAMEQDWNTTPYLQSPATALLHLVGDMTFLWSFVQNDLAEDYFFYIDDGAGHTQGAHFVGGKLSWVQNGTDTQFAAGATDPIQSLHRGALVRSGNNISYYQDGVLVGTVVKAPGTQGATPRMFTGYLSRGKILGLQVIARALTADEVVTDSAYFYSDAPSPPEPGPSAHGNAVGSLETGTIGTDTGSDSVDTACGVCPPAPDLLLKDGASIETGTESIDTATNPTACGSGIVGTPPAGFLWLRADTGDPAYLTKDGSNRVNKWINQFPPALDVEAQNSFGVVTPNTQWPVFTPALAPNGLGGLHLDSSKSQFLLKRFSPGTLNQPTADDEPLLILGVVRASTMLDTFTGMALVNRLTNEDLECSLRVGDIFLYGKVLIPMSSAQNAHAHYIGQGSGPYPNGAAYVTDYSNRMLLMSWQWRGSAQNPNSIVKINGVSPPQFDFSPTAMLPYTGVSGYSVGFCNANAGSFWNGDLFEFLGYRGDDALDPDIYLNAFQYLNQKWTLDLFPPT